MNRVSPDDAPTKTATKEARTFETVHVRRGAQRTLSLKLEQMAHLHEVERHREMGDELRRMNSSVERAHQHHLNKYFESKSDAEKKKLRKSAGTVHIGFRLYTLRAIDHDLHRFTASFRIFYEWCDPELAKKLAAEPLAEQSVWESRVPEVRFVNAVSLTSEEWTRSPRPSGPGGRMYTHRKYEGEFVEQQELNDFPFDVQTLRLSFELSKKLFRGFTLRVLPIEFRDVPRIPGWRMLRPLSFVADTLHWVDVGPVQPTGDKIESEALAERLSKSSALEPEELKEYGVDVRSLSLNSYAVVDHGAGASVTHFRPAAVQENIEAGVVLKHALKADASVVLSVQRESGFYVSNMLRWLGLLTSLGWISFALPSGDVVSRVELCIALLFTLLALRWSVAVPSTNYATALDRYQDRCTLALVAIALLHAAISGVGVRIVQRVTRPSLKGEEEEEARGNLEGDVLDAIDLALGAVTLAAWLGFNFRFYEKWVQRGRRADRVLSWDEKELYNWTGPWSPGQISDRPWRAGDGEVSSSKKQEADEADAVMVVGSELAKVNRAISLEEVQ